MQSSSDANLVAIKDSGASVIQGGRPSQEDRYIALAPGSLKSNKNIALYAVFDGHAGATVSDHLRGNLANFIDEALSKSSPHSPETYKSAIQDALDREDEIIDRQNWKDGSTLALVLIDTQQNILVEADLGDSHMVLAEHTRRNKKEENKLKKLDHTLRAHHLVKGKNEWSNERLSVPHKPDDPIEKKRIEDAGGRVNYDTGAARVGALAMTRAMGDTELKMPRVNNLANHNLEDLVGVETGLKPGRRASADLVTNKAHFAVRHLKGECLVLISTDGIGDEKEAELAARTATDLNSQGWPANEIATELAKQAVKRKDPDNCTVIVVILEAPSAAQ
ncbi:phosphatase 2C family protein [Didymella exigua CBS 183.55]|uniref:Phosphatase 2C family protein n=1 Tax=Didymella exigua CBS 183.55 TaxID=1150837 RepID=A0A6A5RMA3_9PLEO|nr:phosphatase 2C family protein [Didymella exigua CBS 183.55]KAF1928248.1 phosphatase 2C family protein [Didymella exigua CBS 183.55]